MLNEKQQYFNDILRHLAGSLDISPSKYKQAVDSYKAVGRHLNEGTYPNMGGEPEIYPQGSFRLGTVVRPLRDTKEADYDIDLVCQFSTTKGFTMPGTVKNLVGDRLKKDACYNGMLDDEEGRRCWTLQYAEQDGIGFHMDILPSVPVDDSEKTTLMNKNVPDVYFQHAIDLTEKDESTGAYEWKQGGSNPEGYAQWFDHKKTCCPEYVQASLKQKEAIFEGTLNKQGQRIFASITDVPDALVRTPLQRAIQILKRHRDSYFKNNSDNKPISMIITTLSARFYNNERDVYSTLVNVIQEITDFAQYLSSDHKYSLNVRESQNMVDDWDGYIPTIDKPIFKLKGEWYIPNPVNPEENFADRWDDKKATAFFDWLVRLKQDFDLALQQKGFVKIAGVLEPIFGSGPVKNAFIKIGQNARIELDNKLIRTTAKTGSISSKGTINNPKHIFHSNI